MFDSLTRLCHKEYDVVRVYDKDYEKLKLELEQFVSSKDPKLKRNMKFYTSQHDFQNN